jgi:hypothetical protein
MAFSLHRSPEPSLDVYRVYISDGMSSHLVSRFAPGLLIMFAGVEVRSLQFIQGRLLL